MIHGTCRRKEHTTRQPILWGTCSGMPHPCVRSHSIDKSVQKASLLQYFRSSPTGLGVELPCLPRLRRIPTPISDCPVR